MKFSGDKSLLRESDATRDWAAIICEQRDSKRAGFESGTDPSALARAYIDTCEWSSSFNCFTLLYWRGEWFRYRDGRWVGTDETTIRVDVAGFLKSYFDGRYVECERNVPEVTTARITNVLSNLKPLLLVPNEQEPPVWLGDGGPAQFMAFTNGLLNLTKLDDGEIDFMCSCPLWFSTTLFPYEFRADAKCPQWLRFISQVMEGDAKRIALLQEVAGYLLTPDTSQQKFVVLEGEGDNGKSVFLDVIGALLGEENVSHVPLEQFGDRFSLATTMGKLANICAEVGDIDRVAEGIIKGFTSGDPMQFERKYMQPLKCRPTARLIFATNNKPRFKDRSTGIWRRVLLVPFRYTVPPEEKDRQLANKLKEELPGIFWWAVEGRLRLHDQGQFTVSEVCQGELDEYRRESNPARVFLEEHVTATPGKTLPARALYRAYVQWSEDGGYTPVLDAAQFGKDVKRRFPRVDRKRVIDGGKREWHYVGISFTEASRPSLMSKVS